MSPVLPAADMSQAGCRTVLAANFDRALDARFAVSHGQLWSVHPLRALSDGQFLDAVQPVKTLAEEDRTGPRPVALLRAC